MSQRIFSASDFQDPPARGGRSNGRSGGGSVAARVVSALVALLITAPALLLVMAGGARSYSETLQRLNTEPVPAAILLLSAGLVLVLIVSLTGLFSSLGPLVAGLVATGLGIAFLAIPTLSGTLAGSLPAMGVSPLSLLVFWCQSGLLLATGIVFLGAALGRAIAARTHGGGRGGVKAVVSLVVGLVATPLGIVLVAFGSAGLLRSFGTAAESTTPVPSTLGLLLAGAVVLAGVALTSGWSSIGVSVAGILSLLLGLLAVVPSAVVRIFTTASGPLGSDGASGLGSAVALGFIAVLGIVFLGSAASGARARRIRR
ncbi:hypothetical protein QCD70_14665 [Agreia sp. PsM10]|uniref:hypothetical protein n=1 Tax=Agreia sp. PsM10 TaxID=3030533 RepID=UPI00263ACE29|nr:hypothetical protein [Agreia sp. PsM10]MDN4641495.1 hypothetical protein [Agreia sp. PsM10]